MQLILSDWLIYLELLYLLFLILISLRIIFDSHSSSKALAYLLLIFFVPVFGVAFYFSFGINYRKRKMYSKKLVVDDLYAKALYVHLQETQNQFRKTNTDSVEQNRDLIQLISNVNMGENPLLIDNKVEVLKNGEAFFPRLLEDLKQAQDHIHIEYYIYEDDQIGNQIADILVLKAKQGVQVRFIYDDFGCRSIRKTIVRRLKQAGVEIVPFNKIIWIALANRMNYRNHRKIVVIDGVVGYTGGINISDRYDNTKKTSENLFWRDTHLRIQGSGTYGLQHTFLCDWNFASGQNLVLSKELFPSIPFSAEYKTPLQIVSSGPDSDLPSILFSVLEIIGKAKSEILITTPYYIPDESLQQAILMAAMSGKTVKILVPRKSDSKIVRLASESYIEELLKVGVEIYRYDKGFVHAKTIVTDSHVTSIGTCNLDHRSFDLNFEINAVIYDVQIAKQTRDMFYKDCENATPYNYDKWNKRSIWRRFKNSFIRLLSPLL